MHKVRFGLVPQSLLSLGLLLAAAGCGGGGMSIVGITPVSTQLSPIVLDSGETLPITAVVINDITNSGANFTAAGGGTLSTPVVTTNGDATNLAVNYTAPSVATSATATVTATSVRTPSQSATVYLTINPALVINTTTLPSGVVGTAYPGTTITASGGTGIITLGLVSGALPPGLTPSTSAGRFTVSGTPTAYGSFTFTIGATDNASVLSTVSQTYTVTIAPQPPTITSTALPNALVGVAYSQQLTYSGGAAGTPTFTLASGSLPTGLTLSPSGLISGTATGSSSTFGVTVTIGTQTSAAASITLAVTPLPTITTATVPSGNTGFAYSQQLAYTGGGSGTATWAVTSGTLPAGLTLSSGGLLAGTPTTQASYTFSVTVTVGAQTSAPVSYTLPIYGLIITSATTATGEVNLPFSFALTARGGTPPYTWTLASGSAALPAGLTLNASGTITGTPTTTSGSPFTVSVKATDSAATAGTATQAIAIAINPARGSTLNSELSGQYAFLLSGFDKNGNPLAQAGKFTADGNGNITSGVVDTNGTALSTPTLNAALSATTYSVGSDGRGKLTLTSSGVTTTYTISLNQVAGGVASGGYITEFDSTGQRLTGVIALQAPSAFTTASIVNGFAFGTDGFLAGSTASTLAHRGMIGEVQFTGSGSITSGEFLNASTAFSNASTLPVAATSGSISIGANGRGTVTLNSASGTFDFAAYVVSSGKMFLLSSDAANTGSKDLLYGQALQQTISNGSFTTTSLNATAVVRTERLGVTAAGATFPDVQIGLYNFAASTPTLTSDQNAGGTIASNTLKGSYTVATNGRIALSLGTGFGGCTDCVGTQTYGYLVGANQGFLLDFSSPVVSGYFEPQTATGITAASFSGTYAAGSLDPLSASGTYYTGVLSSTVAGMIAGTEDQSAAAGLSPDVPVSLTYTGAATGRFPVTPIGTGSGALYIVSPSKALLIDLSSSTPVVVELQR